MTSLGQKKGTLKTFLGALFVEALLAHISLCIYSYPRYSIIELGSLV